MNPLYLETYFRSDLDRKQMPQNFSIITGYATTGEIWAPEENQSANQALQALLCKKVDTIFDITGFNPESGHEEPGFGSTLSEKDSLDVGLKFRQDAIYLVEGDRLFVSYCDEEKREKVPVGNFEERLNTK